MTDPQETDPQANHTPESSESGELLTTPAAISPSIEAPPMETTEATEATEADTLTGFDAPPIAEADHSKTVVDVVAVDVSDERLEDNIPTLTGDMAAPVADTDTDTAATKEGTEDETKEGRKKKKRRRKKKKPEGEPNPQTTPLMRYFDSATAAKRQALSAKEVVAGRVLRVTEGIVVADLFGRGVAVFDANEPREVPELPPEPEPTKPDPAAATTENPATETATPTPKETALETQTASPVANFLVGAVTTQRAVTEEKADAEIATETQAQAPTANAETKSKKDEALLVSTVNTEVSTEILHETLPLLEPLAVHSVFRGRIASVSESGHVALVNRLIDRAAVKAALHAARDKRERVSGIVFGFNRGGFDVIVGGIRVFCPASGMSLSDINDPTEYIGQKLEFLLPQPKTSKKKSKSVIVSRRSILEREARRAARERMKKLTVGEKLPGTVLEVRDFGVIVDIGGGVDGLVHQSEVSWNRSDRPADLYKPGDGVEVEVLRVQVSKRRDHFGKLALSMRTCLPDPWDNAKDVLKPGAHATGKVTRTAEFGAFVALFPDHPEHAAIEGLLHISELSHGKDIQHAKQAISEGDAVDVIIERVDRSQRRISLSKLSEADKKAMESGEFDPSRAPKSLKKGAHIQVVIQRVEHHGINIQVQGVLGRRGRGYISNRDLSEAGEQKITQGATIEVKIVGTDRDGQLRCSVKGREQDDERRAVKEYRKEASKRGFGTFGDILRAKLDTDTE